jgi:hypothetical protein
LAQEDEELKNQNLHVVDLIEKLLKTLLLLQIWQKMLSEQLKDVVVAVVVEEEEFAHRLQDQELKTVSILGDLSTLETRQILICLLTLHCRSWWRYCRNIHQVQDFHFLFWCRTFLHGEQKKKK